MPTAIVADDEPHLAAYLCDQLAQAWPELEIVHIASDGVDAAECIERLSPDFAFLDIQMPGLTGLEVAQGVEGPTRIVFVTAHDHYALQAFECAAIDYVLKPIGRERLTRTVVRLKEASGPPALDPSLAEVFAKLMPARRREPLRYVRAAQGELMHQVAVSGVFFFRSDEKYTVVQTADTERLIRTSIADLEEQLDPEVFWRVHRSTLINVAHLEGTRRDGASRLYVRIRGYRKELPVSRAYVHLFKAM